MGIAILKASRAPPGKVQEFRFLRVNPAFERLTGRPPGSVVGKNALEVLADLDASWSEIFREVALRKSESRFQTRYALRGTWFEVTAFSPGSGLFVCIFSDVTERKKAEEKSARELREMETLARIVLKMSGIVSRDRLLDSVVEGVSEAVRPDLVLLFLRSGGELRLERTGPPGSGFAQGLFPVHRLGECLCGLAAKEGTPVFSGDIHADARCTWDECRNAGFRSFAALPLIGDGRVVGVLGLASGGRRDFSLQSAFLEALAATIPVFLRNALLYEAARTRADDRQREIAGQGSAEDALRSSEENYRLVVENANDAIVIAQDGVIIFTNPRLADFTGRSVAEMTGRRFAGLIHPEDREAVTDRHARRLRGEKVTDRYDFRFLKESGETVWVENSVVMTSWNGKPATLSFLRDVTQQKQLEELLVHAQKMEAVGRLAGGIAHDFNNLLSVIIGYSHLLLSREGGVEPFLKELLEIRTAAERAAELTRQLLAYSRKQVLQPKVVRLENVVRNMENLLRRVIGEDIELSTSAEGDVANVFVDPGQLEQIILNLAVNARDAMPTGGRLIIGVRNVEIGGSFALGHPPLSPGRHVELSVSDTGAGMDPETASKIFEPFFTTKEVGKGTGLGLSTVYGIVSQSRGHIAVESAPGRGTRFRILFPDHEAAPGAPDELAPGPAGGGAETILVVEDDPGVLSLARRVLTSSGYTVFAAGTGDEALRIARGPGIRFQLLVTDVVLPGMSGRDLAELLFTANPGMRVLFMSGYGDAAIGRREAPDDAIDFLEKPFTPKGLAEKVRTVLDRP